MTLLFSSSVNHLRTSCGRPQTRNLSAKLIEKHFGKAKVTDCVTGHDSKGGKPGSEEGRTLRVLCGRKEKKGQEVAFLRWRKPGETGKFCSMS